jgi:amino acid transporter
MTCLYGTLFIVLGNLSGNAIAFGIYIMEAAGYDVDNCPGAIRGLAIGALTVACLLHAVSRRGGIWLNNLFAFLKVLILLLIIVAGLAILGGASFGSGKIDTDNFDIHTSFASPRTDLASYATSMLYAYYPYTGFLQPFYVLSEVRNPRGSFAKSTIFTMIAVLILYLLVNVAIYSVVPKELIMSSPLPVASLFFISVFGSATAARVMSGIIALSIFGNIIVMTFTAARVKQEIAKEGVLPFSRFFASNSTTFLAWLGEKMSPQKANEEKEELDQSPTAALLLHWTFSVLLIAFTAGQTTDVAYNVLVDLYTYVIGIFISFLVACGLLYLTYKDTRAWNAMCNFHAWGGPAAPILVTATSAFLLVAAFVPPSSDSPYAFANQGFQWFIVPTIGVGGVLLGTIYWATFRYIVPQIKGKQLLVERVPIIVSDDHGGWVQKHEIVEFSWGVRDGLMDEDYDSEEK